MKNNILTTIIFLIIFLSLFRQQEMKNNILTTILDQKARARRELLFYKVITY